MKYMTLVSNQIRLDILQRAEEQLWNRFMYYKNQYEDSIRNGLEVLACPNPPSNEEIFDLANQMMEFVFEQ